jgi:hypothetical protein
MVIHHLVIHSPPHVTVFVLFFCGFLWGAAGGVTSFAWNCECSMLVMVREEELCVVPYPPAVPNDPALLEKFTIRQNIRYTL